MLAAIGTTRDEIEEQMQSLGRIREVEVDGAAAGSVWTEMRDRTLHVHALLLDEEFRGRGVGGAVLRLLEEEVAGEADAVELGVQDANAAARRLYEKAGFDEVERRPEVGFRVLRKRLMETD